jgi:hypothetical protein
MKTLGDKIFAKDADGNLVSRIGTLFLRTPGLVTQRGVHAMQRMAWIAEINRERAEAGRPPLSENEAADELADSVDLIFTDDCVLIRPDPARMDLAFKADDVLQTLVSKRRIRFLNTHSAKVRDALRARGENWRMARPPLSAEEMDSLLARARVAIGCGRIYWYNSRTGTRLVTAGSCSDVAALGPEAFRAQVAELASGIKSYNRLGQPEIGFFPPSLSPDVKNAFKAIDPEAPDADLRAAFDRAAQLYRAALPANLRVETAANFDFRNEMCAALTSGPNETAAAEGELIHGISPEFHRQIEWLPGARVVEGRLIFDPLFDEAARTQDPELLEVCDQRVRAIIFNMLRLFGTVEYVNVGRIARSLARRPVAGQRRGSVYIVQYKETGSPAERLYIIRFQKWGIAEHLDEGKSLLQSMLEANEYADYILDRRLACRQLGMNLPHHVGFGQFTEKYSGDNEYRGTTVRAYYYVRSYIPGVASDKVPPERFRNPAFAKAFATLMGRAAALDMIVGRAATETGELIFDQVHEVLIPGADGIPENVVVTDHAGSFVKYKDPLEKLAPAYANAVRRREKFVGDYAAFAKAYVAAFERQLADTQAEYRARRRAFDELFVHRPYDVAGSGAFRWSCVLKRLDECDPAAVAAALERAIEA